MKFCEALKLLEKTGVPSPKYDAREIFMRIGKMTAAELLSPDAESNLPELISAVERRAKREPLQYIIGEVGFYRECYETTPDALIPRQDTEHLVDFAVKNIPDGKVFLDICTGSGCIAVSTLKNTKNTSAIAIDISDGALSLAERNAERNGVSDRIKFIKSDALKDKAEGKFFAILSNPPYVTETAYNNLESEIYYEPRVAFVADEGGMIFYKKIISLYNDSLEDGGFFAFEIGYDQGEKIKQIASEHHLSCDIIKDYSGCDRIAVIK